MQRDGNFSTPCGRSVAELGTEKKLAFSIVSTRLQYCTILDMVPTQWKMCKSVLYYLRRGKLCPVTEYLKNTWLTRSSNPVLKCLKEVETL